MLGTMVVLADGGIASGVMSEGGKIWQDRGQLGAVIKTGIYLRKRFAVGSLIIATPILFYLLYHHGASWLTSTLIALSLIPAFFSALSGRILEIVPKLHQDIAGLQKIQMTSNIGRLGLLGLTLFVFPWAYIAILASGLPQIWANIQMRKRAKMFSDSVSEINQEVQRNILKIVRRILPGAIYYAFSGQLTVWLISFTGNTNDIASIGALGKLAVVFSLIDYLFVNLIIPRFSRLPDERTLLRKKLIQLTIGIVLLCISIIAVTYIFSNQLLWILGSAYRNLNYELLLIIISSCLGIITGFSFSLASSRGWVLQPLLNIGVSVLATLMSIFLLDISTIAGVIIANILVRASQAVMYTVYLFKKV